MTERTRPLSVPVALILAPRIETVSRVLAAIEAARPKRLYVVADAGWSPETIEGFRAVKALIAKIDWCEVRTNYAAENMGAKRRLSSGISWVFEQEERAIIFEHDCLPHPTFFRFCEELLERYQDDERVMHIGGNNFFKRLGADFESPDSYFFTRVPHIWGFATWRRAWRYYDVNLAAWPQARERRVLYSIFPDSAVAHRWENRLQEYYEGKIDSWDGQWSFAILSQGGLCINPGVNLVSNIGFGPEALNGKDPEHPLANVPTEAVRFPLAHPPFMLVDEKADALTHRKSFRINETRLQRFKWALKSRFPVAYARAKAILQRPPDSLAGH